MVKNSKLLFGFFATSVLFVGIFLFSSSASASADAFVINEIYPAPLVGEKEWVELYNPTNKIINLAEYSIKDGGVAAKALSGEIYPGGYFVFEFSSGWLNNSGETLSLIYAPTSETIDKVAFGNWNDNQDNQPFAPSSGRSLSRISDGLDSDDDKNDFRISVPTKGSENLLPKFSDLIMINEVVPRPVSGTSGEFVELYNSGDAEVDISGWVLDDVVEGGSAPFVIPDGTLLAANKLLSFYNPETSLSLNDSGDCVHLIDPNGDIKSSISYSQAPRGQSFSKFNTDWVWTLSSTPDEDNFLTIETEDLVDEVQIIETDITGAKSQNDGAPVSIIGTVTVAPGKLSSQYFYIQDSGAGIQIYNYSKEFPPVSPGDEVKVVGEVGTITKEHRIKVAKASDIIFLSTHPPPEPEKISFDEVAEAMEGQYVVLEGIVLKTSGSTFYIHGSGEIQVSIRSGIGIKKPRMYVGDKVQIAGILSRYNDTFRVLPTTQSDVKLISSSKLADTGPNLLISIVSSLFFTVLYGIFKQKSLGDRWACGKVFN